MYIDQIIVFSYLIITLLYGLYVGRNVKDIKDYALGGRNFPTAILAATIFATYASSSTFYAGIAESYQNGFMDFFATIGQTMALLFSGYLIGPRMKEFAGKLSAAEMLGSIYGRDIRIVTSLPIIFIAAGIVGIQIKVLSNTIGYFIDIGNFECVIITAMIVTTYSAFGGIRAVTFTDFIQFATFGIAVPLIFVITLNDTGININADKQRILFNHLFTINPNEINRYIIIFIYFLLPTLSPAIIQRMLMAKNTHQIKESFFIATTLLFILSLISSLIGGLVYVSNPDLLNEDIFPYFIDHFAPIGIKGFLLAGILAMAMSTADSHLNSSSISFSHDFCRPLGLFNNFSELYISKVFAFITGILATILSLYFDNVLELLLFAFSFYAPTASVPLLLAIFGFRTSKRALYIAIITGLVTVIIWTPLMMFLGVENAINSFIPGIIAHLIALFGAHYLFKEKGGWRQGPGSGLFNSFAMKQNVNIKKQKLTLTEIFTKLLKNNIPQSTYLYNSLAIYCVIVYVITISFFAKSTFLHIVIFAIVLFASFSLIMRNMIKDRNSYFLAPLYFFTSIFSFPFATTYFLLDSSFVPQFVVLNIISILVMPFLMNWNLSIIGNIIGIIFGGLFFIFTDGFIAFEKIISKNYSILAFTSLIIMSFKYFISKSNWIYISDIMFNNERLLSNRYLLEKNLRQGEENLRRLYNVKSEILNNFSHEIKTPLFTTTSSLERAILLSDDKISAKDALIDAKDNFDKLKTYILRLADLSDFQKNKILFNFTNSELKLILNNLEEKFSSNINFEFDISNKNISLICDSVKIESALSEIVKNSITHAKSETVDITTSTDKESINIAIKDYSSEITRKLTNVDNLFESLEIKGSGENGYKGVGLAIAKEIVLSHGGYIGAKIHSDGKFGGILINISLPLNPYDDPSRDINQNRKIDTVNKSNKRILLVDDDLQVLQSTSLILELKGYKVTSVSSGTEALEYINNNINNIDVILLDIMMPDITGIEVLEKTEKLIKQNNIKVIMQTGIGMVDEYKKKSINLGAKYFCSKPYKIHDLTILIEEE